MSWKLIHPDSDQVLEVDADTVGIYLTQGWQTQSGRTPTLVGDAPLPSISVPGPGWVDPEPAGKKSKK